jgi:hypothetical protein
MKLPIFVTAVSMTHRCDKKQSLVNPHILCVKVIGIVQDNLPMNVFFDFSQYGLHGYEKMQNLNKK